MHTLHEEGFTPPREPIVERLISETYRNERGLTLARATDHEMLQPLPAAGCRPSQATVASTERPWGITDPTNSGGKVNVDPKARLAPLQDQQAYNVYHANTFRLEAEPWDIDLVD